VPLGCPAEAVFAEIHAYHADLVEYAQRQRVWIVSPTTLMAGLNTAPLVGQLAAWNYFESVDTPANKETVAAFKAFTKNDKRVFNDPMEAHYIGFNMWVKAVEKAGTTKADAVIDAMIGVAHPNLSGGYATMMPNHHLTKPVLLGEVQADGQFNWVWETSGLVVAQPWSPYLPESKNLIGDWLPPMSCGNYDVVAGKCLGKRKA